MDYRGKMLDDFDSTSSKIAPTFALIDPFGFSGIPYALIQRLLSKNKCEVLVTVMVDSINRWLAHPDENIKAHIVETFGTGVAIMRRRLLPDFGHFEHRPEGCGYWCRAVAGQSHSGF